VVIARRRLILLTFLFLSFVMAVLMPAQSAFAGIWDGRAFRRYDPGGYSYFENRRLWSYEYYTGIPSYVIGSGVHGMGSVDQFVNFLRDKNRNSADNISGRRDKAGSAFIVQTLLGRSGDQANANGGRNIRDSDFTDLTQRLNAATINWNTIVCTDAINTMSGLTGSNGQGDVMRDPDTWDNKCEPGIRITDRSGNVYRIFHRCANPVGDNRGLVEGLDFNLTPSISGSPSGAVEAGSSIRLNPHIDNSGATASTSVRWWLTEERNGGGQAEFTSGNRSFNRGGTTFGPVYRTAPDAPAGTEMCYRLWVQPIAHNNGDSRQSGGFCVTIAVSPKVQVTGGDVIVGKAATSDIVTSTIRKNVSGDRTFGSWGEYAVVASGTVSGMASGAGYSGGARSDQFCAVSYLTITNAGSGSCTSSTVKGNYRAGTSLPSIETRFTGTTNRGANPTIDLAAEPNGVYTGSGTIRVSASADIGVGRWVVINARSANVVIEGDIRYTGASLSSADEIPQVVIIANNITINESVSRVDSWLIANGSSGRIATCNISSTSELNANRCSTPLTVNGPVASRQLLLYRTGGSGTGARSGDPAEVFNLRPDAYLWATSYSGGSGRLQTVSTQELPPRF